MSNSVNNSNASLKNHLTR